MSIGAYEVGLEQGANVWYLDTATRRLVTLGGAPPTEDLYQLTVEDYMAVYGRRPAITAQPPSSQQVTLAEALAHHPAEAMAFRSALRRAKAHEGKRDQPRTVVLENTSEWTGKFCDLAQTAEMIGSCNVTPQGQLRCELPNDQLWKFMEGLWLEVYAWAAARNVGCFDNYHYGLLIPMRTPEESSSNELDLALTYAASLLIAECKSEEKPFQTEHLDKLRSVASMVGGNFVGCVFIAGQLSTQFPGDKNEHGSYEHFCSQARARQIAVVPGEQLVDLSAILCREAGADSDPRHRPTFFRG
jgi:hypothetical protein